MGLILEAIKISDMLYVGDYLLSINYNSVSSRSDDSCLILK